ncbi:NAD(P)-binding protein [Coniochaeta ligniaria NRRL 30616]|uniref:NAD(P)-binding protein n=1 Tax=Coniochaeta ligniaria NRRL 30616 TaxID=1408157 RepID=A0A1J7J907_9PEZI|nr:NAD(P)-binding protein [Coniochaeta ligniaria NRRL 30616]
MSSPYIVLISGGSRGLGKGLVERYLARPNHLVIAANRNPSATASKSLFDLPKGEGSKLVVVKLDDTVEADAAAAVKDLEAQGIDHLDLVIANAGQASVFPLVRDLKHADLQSHIDLNVFGVLWLFQATLELLKKSKTPKWVTMGSSAGSIGGQQPVPNAAYGPSKAAVHWLTKRIHAEEEWLTSFVMHPGYVWVQTDMGLFSAKVFGLDESGTQQHLLKEGDSHPGMMKVIDEAARETHSGKFWNYEGKEEAW